MQDPKPENIVGQKRVQHTVEWQVKPSYLLAVLLALVIAWKLLPNRSGSSSESVGEEIADVREEAEDAVDIGVSGGGLYR